jgi:hypothetical protein
VCLWASILRTWASDTRKAPTVPSETLDWEMEFDHTSIVFFIFFIRIRYSLLFLTRSHYPRKKANEATDAAVHRETILRGETGALSVQGLVV